MTLNIVAMIIMLMLGTVGLSWGKSVPFVAMIPMAGMTDARGNDPVMTNANEIFEAKKIVLMTSMIAGMTDVRLKDARIIDATAKITEGMIVSPSLVAAMMIGGMAGAKMTNVDGMTDVRMK